MRLIAAILAAGLSRRLGRPKQLLDWHGMPLVRHSVLTVLSAQAMTPQDLVVVVGHEEPAVRAALQGLDVAVVRNPDFASGQGSSVACAAQWAQGSSADALLIALCDQPFLTGTHIDQLWQYWCSETPDVLIPRVQTQPTNPVIWAPHTWPHLTQLSGDQGGRLLIQQKQVTPAWYDMTDTDMLLDIDSEEDYQTLCNR